MCVCHTSSYQKRLNHPILFCVTSVRVFFFSSPRRPLGPSLSSATYCKNPGWGGSDFFLMLQTSSHFAIHLLSLRFVPDGKFIINFSVSLVFQSPYVASCCSNMSTTSKPSQDFFFFCSAPSPPFQNNSDGHPADKFDRCSSCLLADISPIETEGRH